MGNRRLDAKQERGVQVLLEEMTSQLSQLRRGRQQRSRGNRVGPGEAHPRRARDRRGHAQVGRSWHFGGLKRRSRRARQKAAGGVGGQRAPPILTGGCSRLPRAGVAPA